MFISCKVDLSNIDCIFAIKANCLLVYMALTSQSSTP